MSVALFCNAIIINLNIMKKILSVATLLVMVYIHASAWGYDFLYEGFAYNLNDDGSVTLTSDNDFYE